MDIILVKNVAVDSIFICIESFFWISLSYFIANKIQKRIQSFLDERIPEIFAWTSFFFFALLICGVIPKYDTTWWYMKIIATFFTIWSIASIKSPNESNKIFTPSFQNIINTSLTILYTTTTLKNQSLTDERSIFFILKNAPNLGVTLLFPAIVSLVIILILTFMYKKILKYILIKHAIAVKKT
jgi:hypothetical protein